MNTSSPNQATPSKWLNWQPTVRILAESLEYEPPKPSEPRIVSFDGSVLTPVLDGSAKSLRAPVTPIESTVKGQAVELYSNAAGRLFLVADEDDVHVAMERFGVRRGEIYTTAEVQRIVVVNDRAVVAEIHKYKRRFDGKITDLVDHKPEPDKK